MTKRIKPRFVYKERASDKLLARLLTYEIDIAIRDRKASLRELIRAGAPYTSEQREQLASIADRLTLPKKKGRPRGSALTPKQEFERLVVGIVRRLRSKYRAATNKPLEPGTLTV